MTTIKGNLIALDGNEIVVTQGTFNARYVLSEKSKSFIKPSWQGKQVELTLTDGKVSFIKLSQTDTKGGVTTPLKQGSIAPPLSKEPIKDVQQLIIRQSCLSNAVNTLRFMLEYGTKSVVPDYEIKKFIKETAQEYVDWVNGK